MKKYITIVCAMICICVNAQTYITLKTPKGQDIEGINVYGELSASDIEALNNSYITCYPQAEFLGNSSLTYNCHSYAWNMIENGPRCWINQVNKNNGDNVAKYWTFDAYVQVNESSAQKIFYPQCDHSAVKSKTSNGMYESKWGSAPLMRHAPGYGPYKNMDKRRYYKILDYSIDGLLSCSNGSGTVRVNEWASYAAPVQWPGNYSYEFKVENSKEDSVIGTVAEVSGVSITGGSIKFTTSGLYEVYLDIYYLNGEKAVTYWFEVVVVDF